MEHIKRRVIEGLECCLKGCHGVCPYEALFTDDVEICKSIVKDALELLSAETVWVYSTDEEGKPKWTCKNCGKVVHKDPADKLYCSRCGMRARKEA